MTTTNVSDLTGPLLDYWVAKALGLSPKFFGHKNDSVTIAGGIPPEFEVWGEPGVFAPSTNPAQGQPIMEQRRVTTIAAGLDEDDRMVWLACTPPDLETLLKSFVYEGAEDWPWRGHTMLIAAMRAIVASVFGPTVPEVKP